MSANSKAFGALLTAIAVFIAACTRSTSTPLPTENASTAQARQTALAAIYVTETPIQEPTATSTQQPSPTPLPPTQSPTLEPTQGPLFTDVPKDYPGREAIEAVYAAGALPARSQDPSIFGVNDSITRAAMATAICTVLYRDQTIVDPGLGFVDVPRDTQPELARCVEQLYRDKVIAGCQVNPPKYCPGNKLSLAEFAVFFLRAVHGGGWQPPSYQGWPWGYYTANWQVRWGEALIREGYWDLSQGRFLASNFATKAVAARAIYLYMQVGQDR